MSFRRSSASKTTLSNGEAVRKAQLVLLCVKPQAVEEVLRQIADDLTPKHVLISVAASVSTRFMENILGKADSRHSRDAEYAVSDQAGHDRRGARERTPPTPGPGAKKMFDAIGRCIDLDEKHMDAVTALSASGPAFVYIIIESFIEGGVKVGLPRDVATLIAAQMVHGAATWSCRPANIRRN